MLSTGTIAAVSIGYVGLLFAIAYFSDRRAAAGHSVVSNPYIYALSLAVYCTAWTFYGSVGRAARSGPQFLPIYLGPTLTASLGWFVLRKIIRISKTHRITSIADFIASRYGKSSILGGVVTVITVVGIIPYIALQLKAIATSFLLIKNYPDIHISETLSSTPAFQETAFVVSMLLAVFAILFGTRKLDVTERHEGLVAAIAFESIVKLAAFLVVGLFVTYSVYDGFGDLFEQARQLPSLQKLFVMDPGQGSYANWTLQLLLAMLAIVLLPRQFQVTVVENVNERHLNRAIWLFPLYLLAINIFVLPVTMGGLLQFGESRLDADWFVLTLPMAYQQQAIVLFVFLGGLSAATGMVIVEATALATMICNELVMPLLLRLRLFNLGKRGDLSDTLLTIRRTSIVMIMLLGYIYFQFIGGFYALVSIGLVSFTAVAQFGPALIGGIYWKGATHKGALGGLIAGFTLWTYTLVLPSLVPVGLIGNSFLESGPLGIEWLKPFSLFGMTGLDHIAHALFWSMLCNIGVYVGASLFSRPSQLEHTQATLFVDVFKYSSKTGASSLRRGTASVHELSELMERFLGPQRTREALDEYASKHHIEYEKKAMADSGLVSYAETLLGGAIGSASAHALLTSVIQEETLGLDEVMEILDETRQVLAYSRKLEQATTELKSANERLQELDRLKDEFISTVTHELRTPLTSVRSLAEILRDHPDLPTDKFNYFIAIIISESERLTRLIGQVLDIQKIEAGRMQWQLRKLDPKEMIDAAIKATSQLIEEKELLLTLDLPETIPQIQGDPDRLIQVMVNLISNAVKFCEFSKGSIQITLQQQSNVLQFAIKDNGVGISPDHQQIIFEKFRQISGLQHGRPPGSGLGLSITREIIKFHGGRIWVESMPNQGATFYFTLPLDVAVKS